MHFPNFEKENIPWRFRGAVKNRTRQPEFNVQSVPALRRLFLGSLKEPEAREEIERQKRLVTAYQWVGRQVGRGKELSEADLKELHFRATGSRKGYRTKPIVLRTRMGKEIRSFPPPEAISDLIEEFFIWRKEAAADAIVLGGGSHLILASIHPFSDGNGRVARLVQYWDMGGEKVNHPELSANLDFKSYFAAQELARQKRSLRPFLDFLLQNYRLLSSQ